MTMATQTKTNKPIATKENDACVSGEGKPVEPVLSPSQMERYSRQILLDEVGVHGQRRLLDAKVLIIGAGGLGSPASIYLAAAGVGTIGIVDGDVVDVSNLHRQVVHGDADVGRPKTSSAKDTLQALNPDVQIVEHQVVLHSSNALDIFGPYDIIVNGCDNFATRYLVNDAAVLLGQPLVDASILKFHGQLTVFLPGQGCYRCLVPEPPPPGTVPGCAEAGIVGALAGHMGTLQAVETVKLLLGVGSPLSDRLLLYDALQGEHRSIRRRRDPACPLCGDDPTITALIDYEAFCGVPLPAGDIGADARLSLQDLLLAKRWAKEPAELQTLLKDDNVRWIDVREKGEWEQVRFGGAHHMPLSTFQEHIQQLDPEVPTYVFCRSGQRSATVVQMLRENGWNQVYNVHGGLIAWMNEGLPVK